MNSRSLTLTMILGSAGEHAFPDVSRVYDYCKKRGVSDAHRLALLLGLNLKRYD